jgi:CDGSH-type Zn-finger protein
MRDEGAEIIPYRDGPLVVRGSFVLRDEQGREIDPGRRTVALCRCGRSRLRPFCDGSHRKARYRAEGGLSPEAELRHPLTPD